LYEVFIHARFAQDPETPQGKTNGFPPQCIPFIPFIPDKTDRTPAEETVLAGMKGMKGMGTAPPGNPRKSSKFADLNNPARLRINIKGPTPFRAPIRRSQSVYPQIARIHADSASPTPSAPIGQICGSISTICANPRNLRIHIQGPTPFRLSKDLRPEVRRSS
jgi:hypothetical protein